MWATAEEYSAMNTPEHDERTATIHYDNPEPTPAQEPGLTELGKVSDTEGGVLGGKYDSGYGWQYY